MLEEVSLLLVAGEAATSDEFAKFDTFVDETCAKVRFEVPLIISGLLAMSRRSNKYVRSQ